MSGKRGTNPFVISGSVSHQSSRWILGSAAGIERQNMFLPSSIPPLYGLSVWTSVALGIGLAAVTWQRRQSRGAGPLLVRLIATICFLSLYVIPLPSAWVTPEVGTPFLRFRLMVLAFAFIPTAYLALVLEFTQRVKRWKWWMLALLAAEPFVVWYLAFHPSFVSVLFGDWRGLSGEGAFRPTWLFLWHTLYCFAIALVAVGLLVRHYFREAGVYQKQLGLLILAAFPPAISVCLAIAGLTPVMSLKGVTVHMDFTPQAFLISDAMLAYALFRFGYLDIVPVARKFIIEQMSDGILVFDKQDRIIDINASAARLLNVPIGYATGMNAGSLYAIPGETLPEARACGLFARTIQVGDRYVDLRANRLNDFAPNLNSVLVVLRDVTDLKRTSEQLQTANRRLQAHVAEIERMHSLLREQALHDPLTGLYNRHYMEDVLERELAHSARTGQPLAVIMIDIDHFKRINDTYGHLNGDEILKALAQILCTQTRDEDVACRFGGEEFLIILGNTQASVASARANGWRTQFESLVLKLNGAKVSATFSAGIAVCPMQSAERNGLLNAADQALYAAKSGGRNRVVCAGVHAEALAPATVSQ